MRAATSRHRVLGRSQNVLEARQKVTGRPLYVGDLEFSNLAYARILRSPYAHARILSIDASAARAHPGVVSVFTREELIASGFEQYYGYVFRDVPLVALDKVRHQGDIVGVVVAEDLVTAEEALELIEVGYEELPAVLTVDEALAPGAPLIHETMRAVAGDLHPVEGTNICHHSTLGCGHIEEGFREADLVFEDSYSVPAVNHCALELHCCIAQVTKENITVWTNCQSPFQLQRELERIFHRPARVIVPYVGGGFGSKSRDRLEAVCVAAAIQAGRPVKLTLSQEETFLTFKRPALKCTLKTGVKRDGTIVARHYRFFPDSGGYGISGPRNANNTLKVASGPYRIPNVLIECTCAYTNTTPSTPYRGLPTTQHTLAYETQMDRIAGELGMDRVALRMQNLLVEGDIHITGDLHRSVHAKECLQKVADALKIGDPKPRLGQPGWLLGRGVACSMKYTVTPYTPSLTAAAEIALCADGRFEVRFGTVNIGQGSDTTMAQIAAEALGVPLAMVRTVHSDTSRVPPDTGTTSSRSTYHTGNAIVEAAAKLRHAVLEEASHLAEEEVGRLEFTRRGILVRPEGGAADRGAGSARSAGFRPPSRRLSFEEVSTWHGGEIAAQGECISGGTYVAPDGKEYPIASSFWTFGAAGAEVEVSTETGEVRVLRMVAATNVGTAINPRSVLAQLEGGATMDLGPTLFERMVWDEAGQLLTATLMDYPLPTMEAVPEYQMDFVEHPLDGAPFGAKGMGEFGSVLAPAAIVNAVYDATGVLFHDLPLTPDRVLEALDKR